MDFSNRLTNYPEIIEWAKNTIQDLNFSVTQEGKEKLKTKKAVGWFPVYTPMELFYAAGVLPVGLNGGGNQIEITHADSRFGSFICSIVKSTMELGLKGNLSPLDGMVFHSICDSARNLAFVFVRNFTPKMWVEYIHLPQNLDTQATVSFLKSEYERINKSLEGWIGEKVTETALKESIDLYNQNRALLRELYQLRIRKPQNLPTSELYALMRVGNFIPPFDHNQLLKKSLNFLETREGKPRDKIKVVIEGSFCEQPPLELIELLEEAGCYMVDDDFLLGRRWIYQDVSLNGNPLESLAKSYIHYSTYSSVKHSLKYPKTQGLLDKVKLSGAEAVIFLIAKFCEPALFDYVLYKEACEKAGIPHILIEFEEKMWTFEKTRMEIETFVESILFA